MDQDYNLIIASRFENSEEIYPEEQVKLCKEHYQNNNNKFKDYEITKHNSSMPENWCEECSSIEELI